LDDERDLSPKIQGRSFAEPLQKTFCLRGVVGFLQERADDRASVAQDMDYPAVGIESMDEGYSQAVAGRLFRKSLPTFFAEKRNKFSVDPSRDARSEIVRPEFVVSMIRVPGHPDRSRLRHDRDLWMSAEEPI
jgi:hypothetical protein